MDTYKIIITVAGLGLAVLFSVMAELLCKAQTARRASRAERRGARKTDERAENSEDETLSSRASQIATK